MDKLKVNNLVVDSLELVRIQVAAYSEHPNQQEVAYSVPLNSNHLDKVYSVPHNNNLQLVVVYSVLHKTQEVDYSVHRLNKTKEVVYSVHHQVPEEEAKAVVSLALSQLHQQELDSSASNNQPN